MQEILTSSNKLNVSGKVKIELFDSKTLTRIQSVEGSNFISINVTMWLKLLQKNMLALGFPNAYLRPAGCNLSSGQATNDSIADGLLKYLYLSDSAALEDAHKESSVPESAIIGYATRYPYSGADTRRGNINQNETYCNENKLHLVYDFGTDRGNGIIRSVGFCTYPTTFQYAMLNNMSMMDMLFIDTIPGISTYKNIKAYNGFLWAIANVTTPYKVYKLDPVTFAVLGTYQMAYPIGDFCIVDNYIYYGWGSSGISGLGSPKICKYEMSSGTVTELVIAESCSCLEAYNGYLYFRNPGSAFYKIDLATFKSLGYTMIDTSAYPNWVLPPNYIPGIIKMDDKIYLYCKSYNYSSYMRWDPATNTIKERDRLYIPTSIVEAKAFYYLGGSFYIAFNNSGYFNGGTQTKLCLYKFGGVPSGDGQLLSRRLLSKPITKTSANTMKITYDIQMS